MPKTKNLHPNVAAFLDMIAFSEGTAGKGDDGYNVIVGGSLFDSYKAHPNKLIELPNLGISSTAAGRYQLLHRFYVAYKKQLKLLDFSPESQDAIALQQIKERKALIEVQLGNFNKGVNLVSNIWASLPNAGYGQHEHNIEDLKRAYIKAGGVIK